MNATTSKQSINLEYAIRVSPALLYEYITEPVRMQEWFADEVESLDRNSTYIFKWKDSGERQVARLISKEPGRAIAFKMLASDGSEDWQMSFKIITTELSKETILIVEDFVESNSVDIYEQLWNNQIKALRHIFGC